MIVKSPEWSLVSYECRFTENMWKKRWRTEDPNYKEINVDVVLSILKYSDSTRFEVHRVAFISFI